MKYIRTKNGKILDLSWGLTSMIVTKDDILKEADTIEELCDEYVVKHIHALTPMLIDKFTISLKDIKTQYSGNDNFEYIYGAIWTDTGLIYVAKLNEKGELELI